MLDNAMITTLDNKWAKTLRALGIYPGEGLATGLIFGQFVFLGVALLALYSASNAIFLSSFDANAIPYVFVVSAVVLILSGFFFSRLEQRVPLAVLLPGTLGILALLLLLLRVGLWLGSIGVMAFLILVMFRISWTLSNLVVWALASRLFNLRQSKRLFPLVMAGSVVGILATGLVGERLIDRLGVHNLLFIAMGGFLGATAMLSVTLHLFRQQLARGVSNPSTAQSPALPQVLTTYRNRYILWIFGFSMVSTIVTYVLEYVFVSAANVQYQNPEAYANFFGTYLSVATLGLLFISLVGGVLLSRFGLKFGLLVNCAVVASLAVILFFSQLSVGSWAVVFWLVVVTKFSDDVLAVTINSTSIRILLQPIVATRRVSVQSVLESIVVPFSIGVVGLLLILIQFLGDLTTVQSTFLLVVLSLVWVFAGVKVHHAYRLALRKALQKRRIDESDIDLATTERDQVLAEGLQSEHATVVLFSLNLMADADPNKLVALLPQLLNHQAAEVRLDVVRRIEQNSRLTAAPSMLPLLRQRFADEPSAPVQGALCRALIALGDEQMRAASSPGLTHSDREVRAATLVALLRHGGIQGVLIAGPQLLELVHSPLAEERMLGAQIIGQVADPNFFDPLLALLGDEESAVRNAAIEASGLLNNVALWPLLAQAVSDPATRKRAIRALVRGGADALPALAAFFEQPEQNSDTQIALAYTAGQIGGAEAGAYLWRWADTWTNQTADSAAEHEPHAQSKGLNREVHLAIWHALQRSGMSINGVERRKIDGHIERALAHASWLASARQAALDVAGGSLLVDALNEELAQSRAMLFDMLMIIDNRPLLTKVRRILERRPWGTHDFPTSEESEQRAYAQEVLDDLLSPAHKTALLPLLTADLTEGNLQSVLHFAPLPIEDLDQWLHALSSASDAQLMAWTKACAMHAAGIDARHDERRMVLMLSTIEKVIHLKTVSIFSQIPDHVLADIAAVLETTEFLSDQAIVKKGERGDAMYIIISGSVRVTDNGLELERLGENEVFGELALLDNAPRSASVTATEDTLLLRLPQTVFHELLEEHGAIARGILSVLAQRLRARTADLSAQSGSS